MATTITLDPATRLEGHLKVEVDQSGGVVTAARSSGMMFRGFENILIGKDPRDASHITQRVCGVCPIAHAMSACLALEAASGVSVTDNARNIRNLILGSNFIQSHILHFYHLAALSYVKGPAMPPWTPTYEVDLRFTPAQNQLLVDHYLAALAQRRTAHEMLSILGGKMPHTVAYEFGGVTTTPTAADLTAFGSLLDGLIAFIDSTYIPDVQLLGATYPDYYSIGKGYGNLLAYGVFDLNAAGTTKLLKRGRITASGTAVQAIDSTSIVEHTKYSWYNDVAANPATGTTSPNVSKSGGYSWLKAPRYQGDAYECGPLARMWVNGDYRRGISVMDRHVARALEAQKVANAMKGWLAAVNPSASGFTSASVRTSSTGIGWTEAPRGAIGHWLRTDSSGKVASYQILTPTCWNCSPRDTAGLAGPLEKALEDTPVQDATQPVEVLRVIQSYDPCLSCAVH
jgi:hydrogenase large subunit